MRIEDYFATISQAIKVSPIVQSSNVAYDKRSDTIGFIRGDLYFADGSRLHLREYVDVETYVARYSYAYDYRRGERFIFRYDNTDHHRHLQLPTHPHHKHEGQEGHVVASPAPTLSDVLREIELIHTDILDEEE